jgi:tRNA threonylcarbamoyladenosine biosynthesis protein TsaB
VRVLAIETSCRAASVALLDGDTLVAAEALSDQVGTAASLAPAIAALLERCSWRAAGVELIGVARGPGSFTGLRVGVTTAKTLAYALRCQVLGVDTLEAVANQVSAEDDVVAVLDAQRNQLFSTRFSRAGAAGWQMRQPSQIVDLAPWLASLSGGETVAGLGLKRILPHLPAGVRIAPEECWQPRAETVGRLALRDFLAGRRDDLWQLVPRYLRRSAAEEKREAAAVKDEG